MGHIVSMLSGHVAEAFAASPTAERIEGTTLAAESLSATYDYWLAARDLSALRADFRQQSLDERTVTNLAAAGVSQSWPDIYALATALRRQEKLSGDERDGFHIHVQSTFNNWKIELDQRNSRHNSPCNGRADCPWTL